MEGREGRRPDLSRIDPEDANVYDMINAGLSKGVFLLQSPAQLKMGLRLKSRNLLDLAYQVALIRPGVGVQGSAVSQFVERYRHGAEWEYGHPLEARALERGYGIIVWQEHGGAAHRGRGRHDRSGGRRGAPRLRPGPTTSTSSPCIGIGSLRARDATASRRRPPGRFFSKITGHYMFPESHSHAFAVTAYQAAWLKCYYPLEFFVGLINNQPMGFYPMETLKQDARRFGVPFLNPCVNESLAACAPESGSVRLGLQLIKGRGGGVGEAHREGKRAARPLRHRGGPGAADGTEDAGRAVAGDGRRLREVTSIGV